jgi:hypothetical protein
MDHFLCSATARKPVLSRNPVIGYFSWSLSSAMHTTIRSRLQVSICDDLSFKITRVWIALEDTASQGQLKRYGLVFWSPHVRYACMPSHAIGFHRLGRSLYSCHCVRKSRRACRTIDVRCSGSSVLKGQVQRPSTSDTYRFRLLSN